MSSDARLSKQLFDEGLALKRNGNFRQSIQKYKESIRVYTEDPELNSAFYALGKVLYLDGQYERSLEAYQCYFFFSIVPQLISDFDNELGRYSQEDKVKRLFNGIINHVDSQMFGTPIAQLVSFFSNPCPHFGHAALDSKERSTAPDVVNSYRLSLMGKSTPNEDWRNSEYTFKCMLVGLSIQCNIIDEYIKDSKGLSQYFGQLASQLIS